MVVQRLFGLLVVGGLSLHLAGGLAAELIGLALVLCLAHIKEPLEVQPGFGQPAGTVVLCLGHFEW